MNEFQVTGFPDGTTFYPMSTMADDNLFLGILFNGSIQFESTTSSTTPYQVSIRLDGTEVSNSGTITSGIVAATGIPIEHRTSTGYFTVHILSDDNITFQSLKWQLSKYVQANYLSEGTMYTPDYVSTSLLYPPNGSTEVSSTGNYRQQTTGNLGATTSCPTCTTGTRMRVSACQGGVDWTMENTYNHSVTEIVQYQQGVPGSGVIWCGTVEEIDLSTTPDATVYGAITRECGDTVHCHEI